MKDKAGKLLEICTKLIETAAVLEITDLQLDTVKNSARVGHWRDGYAFTGYGTVTLKVTFGPPPLIMPGHNKDAKVLGVWNSETNRIEAANTTKGQATEA